MDRTDWHLLECFRVAGRLQHVTRAAEQLGTSQPALSRSLARLQSDLGVQLFRRAGRSIRLTKPGERVPVAGRARARARSRTAAASLAISKPPIAAPIALGFLRTLGAKYIPELVRRFSLAPPGRAVRLRPEQQRRRSKRSSNAASWTSSSWRCRPAHAGFGWARIVDQELVLIVPRGHRLARRRQVRLREVADEPFVSFKQGHAIRRMTDDLCKAAGFVPADQLRGRRLQQRAGLCRRRLRGRRSSRRRPCGYADVASLKISRAGGAARRSASPGWKTATCRPARSCFGIS